MDLSTLRIRLGRTENLPVLPEVVGSVLRLVGSDTSSTDQIKRHLESDSAIVAKLMRVANAPMYCPGERTTTLGRAISVLGIQTIKGLLLGVAYSQRSTEGLRSREFKRHDFWRHSLAVATSSRMLADHALPLRTDELFLAGMLHDIGLLVLDRFLPVELDVSLGRAHRMELPLHEVERSIHGWDHAEIGALLIEIWGLAPILHDAVRYHHSPDDSADFPVETLIVALADSLAHQAGFRGGATHPPEVDPALMDRLEIDETTLLIIEENMKDEVFEVESVLLAA